MKRAFALVLALAFCFIAMEISLAAEKEAAKTAAPVMRPRMGASTLYGSITNIDRSDPAAIKIEVKNDADNSKHTVELMPNTYVLKSTDASELKAGDNVRVSVRKMGDKEVTGSVMFGNIKKPMPRSAYPAVPPAQQTPKK
jgi:Cu/Ag efflux protein CusF